MNFLTAPGVLESEAEVDEIAQFVGGFTLCDDMREIGRASCRERV